MIFKYRCQYFFFDNADCRREAIDRACPAMAGADERAGS